MQIPYFKIQAVLPFFYSLGETSPFFILQGRPEFSEVVTKLEECLCNIEVRNLASEMCSLKSPDCPRMLGNVGKWCSWKESVRVHNSVLFHPVN